MSDISSIRINDDLNEKFYNVLLKNYIPEVMNNNCKFELNSNLQKQYAGEDFILKIDGQEDKIIDAKVSFHYVNMLTIAPKRFTGACTDTFAFELGGFKRGRATVAALKKFDNSEKTVDDIDELLSNDIRLNGWFVNNSLLTQYYMLGSVKNDNDGHLENIDVILVDKNKIIAYLATPHICEIEKIRDDGSKKPNLKFIRCYDPVTLMNMEPFLLRQYYLSGTDKSMRINCRDNEASCENKSYSPNELYFTVSKLPEKPVNIHIQMSTLLQFADGFFRLSFTPNLKFDKNKSFGYYYDDNNKLSEELSYNTNFDSDKFLFSYEEKDVYEDTDRHCWIQKDSDDPDSYTYSCSHKDITSMVEESFKKIIMDIKNLSPDLQRQAFDALVKSVFMQGVMLTPDVNKDWLKNLIDETVKSDYIVKQRLYEQAFPSMNVNDIIKYYCNQTKKAFKDMNNEWVAAITEWHEKGKVKIAKQEVFEI